jgi:hypothetical protein
MTPIIVPFCIIHSNNYKTSTYKATINYPVKIKSSDTYRYECSIDKKYGSWRFYNNFYALSESIRPITSGLKLISAIHSESAPYNTKYVEHSYDPFNIQKNAVSFITWTHPVSGTVPLYLHVSPLGDSYPSFDINPPDNDKTGWTLPVLSKLYVLVDPLTHISKVDANGDLFPKWDVDIHGIPIFKFRNSNNICIPDINGTSIEDCILSNSKQTTSLLKHLQSLKNYEGKKDYYLLKLFIFICVTAVLLCGVILIK